VGTKHFYLIFFWTEMSLIYLQDSADYFIISLSMVHHIKRILSNARKGLKGRRRENSWVEHENWLKDPYSVK